MLVIIVSAFLFVKLKDLQTDVELGQAPPPPLEVYRILGDWSMPVEYQTVWPRGQIRWTCANSPVFDSYGDSNLV